ncbi:hypothetical protein [Paenibacillus sp. IHBB 10380]|uniref:hypothetical protein n=1 Tax=Paenibacillus sp. IHBB 10380 TaxID=1566358 RepID=UPI000A53D6B4|nr:hypothetical protein [Paenibacillus sp. IHBB 10380]
MPMKYLGKIVEIMYMDQSGEITQRRIEVNSIRNGAAFATLVYQFTNFCLGNSS